MIQGGSNVKAVRPHCIAGDNRSVLGQARAHGKRRRCRTAARPQISAASQGRAIAELSAACPLHRTIDCRVNKVEPNFFVSTGRRNPPGLSTRPDGCFGGSMIQV
mmetsp:Transcript_7357/g.6429  ORF Transcript_7357/g.6429 Transcript_7357/m.6429 type:complete len:105 (+) Transcript_7357:91-405(+)